MLNLKKKLIFSSIFLFSQNLIANIYSENDFKQDLFAPYTDDSSIETFKYGSILTGVLVIGRKDFTDDIQKNIASDKPLGEFSHYGDLLGQTIPNIAYVGFNHFNDDPVMKKNATGMFKATFFSGFTTFFLKRLFNQKRPDGGDRNSFPSGHTTTAFAFSSYIANIHENWKYEAYALGVLVGLSRMNDNVHYLHDVTMGATIGIGFGKYFSKLYGEKGKVTKKEKTSFYTLPIAGGLSYGLVSYF